MKFIIPSLVGAIIGYITNWLAIKMLFRPHEEKRIFGIKVPFTPGLIPKEKDRIAKSVGETIGTHLLSKETMVEALCNDKINNHMKNWITEKIEGLSKCEDTLMSKLSNSSIKDSISIKGVKNSIGDFAVKSVSDDNFKTILADTAYDFITNELRKDTKDLLSFVDMDNFKYKLIFKVENFKDSESFNEGLKLILKSKLNSMKDGNKTLLEILPEGTKVTLKNYTYNNREDIAKVVLEEITKPEMEYKIKAAISKAVSSNVSPLVAMFLNPESLYGKFITFIKDYLSQDDNKIELTVFINSMIDKIFDTKVSNILNSMADEDKNNSLQQISDLIKGKLITRNLLDTITTMILKAIDRKGSIHEILLECNEGYEQKLRTIITSKVDEALDSDKLKNTVSSFVASVLDKNLNKTIGELISGKESNIIILANDIAENIFNKFIENEAMDIIELINIEKIVEEKIKSFDVAFAEKIILDIASKELSAITWLGALLGAIMGIMTPFLNSLY